MNKKIKIKPIDSLTIEFADGTSVDAKWTAMSALTLNSAFGGFKAVMEGASEHPYETCAKLFYCSLYACDNTITYERAQQLVSNFDVNALTEVMNFLQDALHTSIGNGVTPVEGVNWKAPEPSGDTGTNGMGLNI